jgi:hypothetical protein
VDEADIRAAMFRHLAHRARALAAIFDLAAACMTATASARRFAAAVVASEASEVAQHPDLAELNVRLDGFYD